MTLSFNQFSCDQEECGFITVDESELEDHKQFHNKDHVHAWAYKFEHKMWVCECGMMTDYFCIYCNQEVNIKDIPKEALKKLGSQVFFHSDCIEEHKI